MSDSSLLHDFNQTEGALITGKVILVLVIVAMLGIGTGYVLAPRSQSGSGMGSAVPSVGGTSVAKGTIDGANDPETFKDTTQGVLKEGGIDGEGQYHLVRPGGDSQNVYLTSSIVDLSKYVNHTIKVWGQTQKAQKAGWLMDVGKIEVVE